MGTRATNVALVYRYRVRLRRGVYNWRVMATDIDGHKATKRVSARLTVK